MALRIKLSRVGSTNNAHYRIVIAEARSRRDGSCVENIGHYNPHLETNPVTLKADRLAYWLSQGAQFTKGTKRLLSSFVS